MPFCGDHFKGALDVFAKLEPLFRKLGQFSSARVHGRAISVVNNAATLTVRMKRNMQTSTVLNRWRVIELPVSRRRVLSMLLAILHLIV